jgi:hypothetical protein
MTGIRTASQVQTKCKQLMTKLGFSGSGSGALGPEPATMKQAMARADAPHWRQACEDELAALHEMGTWVLAPLPHGRKALPCT